MSLTGKSILVMIEYNSPDIKRINHALKVYSMAKAIGSGENLSADELEILECGAIFHDIGIHEAERIYNSTSGKYQEILGKKIAPELLAKVGYDENSIEQICYLIANHHSYGTRHKLLQMLFEADFIVNLDEGEFHNNSFEQIRDKMFKTKTGANIINNMFDTKRSLPKR